MVTYKIVARNPRADGGGYLPGVLPMSLYSGGSRLGEFPVFRNLKYSKNLNYYGNCSFEIPINKYVAKVSNLLQLRKYEVEIYRTENGATTLEWAGEMALKRGKITTSNDDWMTVESFTFFEQLNSRYTDQFKMYTQIDQGQLVWDLIDTTQSQPHGDMGISKGTIAETIPRDRQFENNNIMEVLVNMSDNESGFDFEITDNKVFNLDSIIGTDKTQDIILQLGHNITEAMITEDFVRPVNRAIVVGQATDASELLRIEKNDSNSQQEYGLREAASTQMDISEKKTLYDKGAYIVERYGFKITKLDDVKVIPGTINVSEINTGDSIRVVIQKGLYNIDTSFRIFGYEVRYSDERIEYVSITLANFTL